MIPTEYKRHQQEQRAFLKIANSRRTAAQIRVPLVGDPQLIITNRAFDITFFLLPITKLLGPIVNTRILAWSFHEVGYAEFHSLLTSNVLGSVGLKAKREAVQVLESYMSKHTCRVTKTRAKAILVEDVKGTRLSLTSNPWPDGEIHTVSRDPDQWTKLSELWESA
jgi:hypothetical protein